MKKTNNETENARLIRELSEANKQIKKLSIDSEKSAKELLKSKEKIAKLQKELKKNDVRNLI